MKDLQDKAERIFQKIQQLQKQNQKLQKENARLEVELKEKKSFDEMNRQKILLLEEKLAIAKVSGGNMDEAARKEFEQRINHYIREIDKCISSLSE
jgi:hypothetical protein